MCEAVVNSLASGPYMARKSQANRWARISDWPRGATGRSYCSGLPPVPPIRAATDSACNG
eukprot:8582157-Pyramimonas_sp.AAC.1